MGIDYSERPDGMSRLEWGRLCDSKRQEAINARAAKRLREAEEFEIHMRYAQLATDELTWLRDRILEIMQSGQE